MLVFFHQFVLVRVTTHEQPSRTMRIIFLNECAVGDVGPWHCCGRIFQMVCQRCDLHSRALKLFLCDSVSIDAPLWSWKDLNEDVSQMKQELPRWLLGGQDGLVGVVGLHNYTWLQWCCESKCNCHKIIWVELCNPGDGTVEQEEAGEGLLWGQCADFTWRVSTMFSGWGRPEQIRWRGHAEDKGNAASKKEQSHRHKNMWMKQSNKKRNQRMCIHGAAYCRTAHRRLLP